MLIGHGGALILVSVLGGYWLLERAEGHKGELRSIGRILGALLIVLSLLGLVLGVWGMSSGGQCPFMGKQWNGMHRMMPPGQP